MGKIEVIADKRKKIRSLRWSSWRRVAKGSAKKTAKVVVARK